MRCNTKKYTQRGFVEALVPLLFWGGVIFMIYFVGTQFAGKKIKNQTENSATNCIPIKNDDPEPYCSNKPVCVCHCK
jgi:hypothetical protein